MGSSSNASDGQGVERGLGEAFDRAQLLVSSLLKGGGGRFNSAGFTDTKT
jgi:hypothetical protein